MNAQVGRIHVLWLCSLCFVLAGCGDENSSARCAIQIPPLSRDVTEAAAQAFIERYGDVWDAEEIEPYKGYVVRARRPFGPVSPDAQVALDREQAIARARQFMAQGAELYGMTEDQVAELQVFSAWHIPDSNILQWSLDFYGVAPVPGYEALWPGTYNTLHLNIDIAQTGDVVMVVNRSHILPRFEICMDPLLEPDDPRLFEHVLGESMYYADFTGETQLAGVVRADNIAAVELSLFVDRTEEGWLRVRLTYRIDVAFVLLTWSFYVNPDTGALIHVQQNFET